VCFIEELLSLRTLACGTVGLLTILLFIAFGLLPGDLHAQSYTGKPFSATAANPVTGAPVELYIRGAEVRADFLPPPQDPTAKNDLIYTLAFFNPRSFYQVSPHDRTCQAQVSLLPAKSLEDYLSGFSPSVRSLRSPHEKFASQDVTVNGLTYTVLEPVRAAAGSGRASHTRIWILKDLGLVTKMETVDRSGKIGTTHFLKNIDLNKPDQSLFVVPGSCRSAH